MTKWIKIIIGVLLILFVVFIGIPLFFRNTHYSGHKNIRVQIADTNKYEGCDISYVSLPIRELVPEVLNNQKLLSKNLKKAKNFDKNIFEATISTEGYISLFDINRTYRNDTDLIVAIDCPNQSRIIKTAQLPNLRDKDNENISVK